MTLWSVVDKPSIGPHLVHRTSPAAPRPPRQLAQLTGIRGGRQAVQLTDIKRGRVRRAARVFLRVFGDWNRYALNLWPPREPQGQRHSATGSKRDGAISP